MATSKSGLCTVLSSKKEEDDIPVAPCQGWVDPCEFCDKRFGNWLEVDEDVLEKIPLKPGIFMLALKNKNVTEVNDIVLDNTDIQKPAYITIDSTKDRIADKKSKTTKSIILCRWMNFKSIDDKDVVNLCAHWYNNGVLPKRMQTWPGLDILEKTKSLAFSDYLQKWCYPKKDAYWKKSKSPSSKLVEVIDGCDWNKQCEICDENFSKWKKLDDVVHNNLSPDNTGIYMVSVCCGKEREVVDIRYDPNDIMLNIRNSLQNSHKSFNYVLKNKKFVNRNPTLQVRWVEFKNPDTDNCCYLYAHWMNAGSIPIMSHRLPGERLLDVNKYFVMRSHDKKWCYAIDAAKQIRDTKSKNKKHILDDLEDDIRYLNCSVDA